MLSKGQLASFEERVSHADFKDDDGELARLLLSEYQELAVDYIQWRNFALSCKKAVLAVCMSESIELTFGKPRQPCSCESLS